MTDVTKAVAAAREAERRYLSVPASSERAHSAAAALSHLLAALDAQEPVAWGMPMSSGEIIDAIPPGEHAKYEGGYTVPLYAAPPAQQVAVPADARGYTDDDRKRIVSGMQSMRDRLGGFLAKTYGDQFDGDIDLMLEATNFMKALRVAHPAPVAVPEGDADTLEALRDYVERCGYKHWLAALDRLMAHPAPVAVPEGWQEQLADSLECFWNAAIGAEHNGSSPAGAMAQGVHAIAARLREHAMLAAHKGQS